MYFFRKNINIVHSHEPSEIAKRLSKVRSQNYLRDWIYGGIDGAVTTLAVIASVVGARLSVLVILIVGFANLIADGFSMAASNYLGTKSEEEEYQYLAAVEAREVDEIPEGEREEVRQIYRKKGLKGEVLESVVKALTSDRKLWIETMLREEYGLPAKIRSSKKAALSTFSAFIICGMAPLLPYLFVSVHQFIFAFIFSGIVFFVIGSIKSRWSVQSWWYSGSSTLLIGILSASIAYGIGYGIKMLVSS